MRKRFERPDGRISWEEQEYLILATLEDEKIREAVVEKIKREEGDYDRDDLVSLFTEYEGENALTFYQLLDTAASDKAIDYIESIMGTDNEIEQEYEKFLKIEKAYDEGNENEKEKARQAYKRWKAGLEKKGKDFCKIYRLHEEAKERRNERIDLNDVVWDKDAAGLIQLFRKYGFKEFTLSANWSGAIETAWLFKQAGCELKGMMEINGKTRDLWTGGLERVHALLFEIKERT